MNGQYVNESKTIRVPWSYDRGLIMTGFFTPPPFTVCCNIMDIVFR